jgi:hypothetical protein
VSGLAATGLAAGALAAPSGASAPRAHAAKIGSGQPKVSLTNQVSQARH